VPIRASVAAVSASGNVSGRAAGVFGAMARDFAAFAAGVPVNSSDTRPCWIVTL